jgi:folylpolyglutamate synthase/dihydropteroate synthase
MNNFRSNCIKYNDIIANFGILLGDVLITSVKFLNRVNLIANVLDKYGDKVPKIQLDEVLLLLIRYNCDLNGKYSGIKDKLMELGANKNILSVKPYSFKLIKFFKKYQVSKLYCSGILANKVLMKSNFSELEKSLGKNPIGELKNIIHVTGSNGKGSTTAFLQSILEAHGYTVNRYLKPYLIRINEEIVIGGKEISDDYICEVYEKTMETYLKIKDTDEFKEKIDKVKAVATDERIKSHCGIMDYIQLRVISALLAFYENPADFNIVEVRVGGLKDVTNVFTEKQTVATVLTNIQYGIGSNDKEMWMMDEQGQIEFSNRAVAYNKSMLGKFAVPMIVANQSEDVLNEIRRVAKEEVKTNTEEYGRDWFIRDETENSFIFEGCGGYSFKLNKSKTLFEKFQVYNTATAIATFLTIIKDKSVIKPELI